MKKKAITITDEDNTRAFGLRLAQTLKAGDVIALIGDLGSGKTALTKYIAEGLGIFEQITSPTFTIVKEYYSGRLPLYHFDVYRISDEEEMYELGYEEYLYGNGVTVIEWADKIKKLLPERNIVIRITHGSNEFERIYEVNDSEKRESCIF